LYENLTGRQYVEYLSTIYKVKKDDYERLSFELVKKLEMSDFYDLPISSYSHGMKQKITIISVLVHEPKIWILDEPMVGLDPYSIFEIKEMMKDYAKKGNIVFFSSHIIDVVQNICDDIIIIKEGKLIEEKTINDYEKEGIKLEAHFLSLTGDSNEKSAVADLSAKK
jgi:ABC-2 type transport system ATP-binding protein